MSWGHANQLLVKEHVGMFKAANNYDIFDLHSGEPLMECREPNLGMFNKMFRFSDYKRMTPFDIHLTATNGEQIARIHRGFTFIRSHVGVMNGADEEIGSFKQKLFSIGGKFGVLDEEGDEVCQLKGKWTGWDFRFLADDVELAHVTKKWAGIGKELFTSADNYILDISEVVPSESDTRRLILAAVMCIDMVLKE